MADPDPSPTSKTVNQVINSKAIVENLLGRCKHVSEGKALSKSCISLEWIEAYAKIAKRSDREQRFGLCRYPFQARESVFAFRGGVLNHDDGLLRCKLAK